MPARADSPEVFSGSAAAKALDLVVLDKQATFGESKANADSTGAATASGTGALLPDVDPGAPGVTVPTTVGGQSADASKADPDVKAKKCAQPPAGTLPSFVHLGVVCTAAEARKGGGNPSAKSEASLAEVGLNAEFGVEQLDDVELGSTLSDLLDRICDAVVGLPEDVGNDQEDDVCEATDTLGEVVTGVLKTKSVLDATVGKTTSSVTTDAAKVTSTATASGATVKVLPLPEVAGLTSSDPLATVSISEASATAVYDRGAGTATASFDPAIVRITFNPGVVDALPPELKDALAQNGVEPSNEIVVTSETLLDQGATVEGRDVEAGDETVTTPEQKVTIREALSCKDDPSSICLPVGPLEVRIRVGNGRVVTNADGSVHAVADGVSVQAFLHKVDLPDEAPVSTREAAVKLAVAHAEAAVGGQAGRVTTANTDDGDNGSPNGNGAPPELSRTLPPAELPRTGGTPWVPMTGALVLSLAVIGRRVAAKATR